MRKEQKEGASEDLNRSGTVYFGGIGGVSMSSLAVLTQVTGKRVRGCDRATDGPYARLLRNTGIAVEEEKETYDLADVTLLVVSQALSPEHPLLRQAREMGIPICSRTAYLRSVTATYPMRVAVCGCHGKSTVTGMLSHIFTEAGRDPTVLCGAPLSDMGAPYRLGGKEVLIYEACEYRDAFLETSPTHILALNIEHDHPDWFQNTEAVARSFSAFFKGEGRQVYGSVDSPALREILPHDAIRFSLLDAPFTPQDAEAGTDYVGILGEEGEIGMYRHGEPLGTVRLTQHGRYMREDATAAFVLSHACGISYKVVQTALSSFRPVGRRMEKCGEWGGATVYADYAHHPTELRAVLASTLSSLPKGARLHVVFEPHTYSRTKAFADEFATTLSMTDRPILLPVFAAREPYDPGVSVPAIARACGGMYAHDYCEAAILLSARVKKGDVVLLLGAGDVPRVWDALATLTPH